jgi:hypothetical protein
MLVGVGTAGAVGVTSTDACVAALAQDESTIESATSMVAADNLRGIGQIDSFRA